jgi:hypothetical protein
MVIGVALFLLPAVGAWVMSRMAYTALKKRQKKWALGVAIPVFIVTYVATFLALLVALVNAVGFHR